MSGTLFPSRYLSDRLAADAAVRVDDQAIERHRRQLVRWWDAVAERAGPASGVRALFDLVAMPLFGMLGYRARDAVFGPGQARAQLVTRTGTVVGLVLLPWAAHSSSTWRDLFVAARDAGASWCFLVAPPFVSIVDARGHAGRRSVDFTLPAVLHPKSFLPFWTIVRAEAFDAAHESEVGSSVRIDMLIASAMRFQDGVGEDLQRGVEHALDRLRGALTTGAPNTRFEEALTIVYRILFLLFAESRDLVPEANPIYGRAYTVGALVRDALTDRRGRGAWDGLAAISRLSRLGCRTSDLTVRPFNGRLFARRAAPSLEQPGRSSRAGRRAVARDTAMQHALVALGSRRGAAGREEITYADLGVEQLGAVYERVLDLDPGLLASTDVQVGPRSPWRAVAEDGGRRHSPRRKQSGTFYTPQPLAEFVVRRTLAPLVSGRSADAILSLRVVDPAMGSGAFLVAACRYLAAAYERALLDEGRTAPADVDEAERANIRRLVAERCLAGVDRNPVAVELARLSLWLATLARGRPLTFLDHRLRVGNSLVGASPDELTRTAGRRRASIAELPLFNPEATEGLEGAVRAVAQPLGDLLDRRDETVSDVRTKEAIWAHLVSDRSPVRPWRVAANLWCAQWFRPAGARPLAATELRAALDAVLRSDRTLPAALLSRRLAEARSADNTHAFFHWPLEFSDVFYDRAGRAKAQAGFDAVVGNPPWEMLRQDSVPVSGENADPDGRNDRRQLVRFIRESGIYSSCGTGHMNLYQPFLERALSLCRPGGRAGLILPWGLAADDGAASLRRRLLEQSGRLTIVGLDNAKGIFPVHRGLRFVVAVASPGAGPGDVRARFGVKTAAELDALPGRDTDNSSAYPVRLSVERLRKAGGPTLRLPDARRPDDLALVERFIDQFPRLGDADGWGARFGRELNASEDRPSFGPTGLPVVEGKHLEPFRVDTWRVTQRIERTLAVRLLPDARFDRARLGYRDVSGVGNKRTLIAAVIPAHVVTTHTVFCLRTPVSLTATHLLCGLFNSYVLNMIVRMLMGGHLTTSLIEELPVPVFSGSQREQRIARLSERIAAGATSPAVVARLEAEVALLYGIGVQEFRRIVDGFPLVATEERGLAVRALEKAVVQGPWPEVRGPES